MEISQSDLLCVCKEKHSDCVIFAPSAPAKTQHINYALTTQPNKRVYNSLQMLSVKITAIIWRLEGCQLSLYVQKKKKRICLWSSEIESRSASILISLRLNHTINYSFAAAYERGVRFSPSAGISGAWHSLGNDDNDSAAGWWPAGTLFKLLDVCPSVFTGDSNSMGLLLKGFRLGYNTKQ